MHRSHVIPEHTLSTTALYASLFQLQALPISLTCSMNPAYPLGASLSLLPSSLASLQTILDTLVTMLGNVDNASLLLKGLTLQNLHISPTDLVQRLTAHYFRQVLSQVYRVVGSSTILGNPIGLLDSLGTGVKAFLTEPVQGLAQSPGGFVGGLGRGTTSLVRNTTYGVCNSMSKFTGTLGDSLSSLTMSEEYRTQRAAGKSGIFYGVKEGITGVVKDTVQGARDDGFLGMIKGTGKGLAGLMLKPVTGVLDDTTKFIEGVKTATHIEKTLRRIRPPRYIYGDGVLSPFCWYLAEGQLFLQGCLRALSLDADDRYVIHVTDNQQNYLFLTQRAASLITPSSRVLWTVPFDTLVDIDHQYNVIHLTQTHDKRVVVVSSPSLALHLCLLVDLFWSGQPSEAAIIIKHIAALFGEVLTDEDAELGSWIEDQSERISVDELYSESESEGGLRSPLAGVSMAEEVAGIVPSTAVIVGSHKKSDTIGVTRLTRTREEYEIEVTGEGMTWTVYRRYGEFQYVVLID